MTRSSAVSCTSTDKARGVIADKELKLEETMAAGVGVIADKELKLEETEAPHTDQVKFVGRCMAVEINHSGS